MSSTLGPADPLPHEAVIALRQILRDEKRLRDLALFNVGIDSYLRSCDLVALHVGDVMAPGGRIRASFTVRQRKTKKLVECHLYGEAQRALGEYLATFPHSPDGCLFPGRNGQPLSTSRHRYLMEDWKALLRWSGYSLPDGHFSTHSVRKAKPAYIYDQGGDILTCMHLLGQTDAKVTQRYLGRDIKKAHEVEARFKF